MRVAHYSKFNRLKKGFTPLEKTLNPPVPRQTGEINRRKKNSLTGFTLIEIVIGVLIVSLVIAGLIASYLVIQRSWSGGAKQIVLQSQVRVALNHISRNIREAKNAEVDGVGKTLTLTRLDDSQIRYVYNEITHQLTCLPNWPATTGETILIKDVWPQPNREGKIFERKEKMCYIWIRVIDLNAIDGYQGIDLVSAARYRN